MTAAEAKERGFLPVYASHIPEVLAAVKSFTALQARRQTQGKLTKLDTWLSDFIQRLEMLALYMTIDQADGIVYLRKNDRELIRTIAEWNKKYDLK